MNVFPRKEIVISSLADNKVNKLKRKRLCNVKLKKTVLRISLVFFSKVNAVNDHGMLCCETILQFLIKKDQVSSQEDSLSTQNKTKQS